jgi:hypothetical protein
LDTELQVDVFHAKFYLVVLLYEDKQNDPDNCLVRTLEDLPEAIKTVIVKVESAVLMKGAMNLGVLWPVDLFRKHEGRDPPKHLVKIYTHKNQKVRGIVREPCHGCPIGTITLTEEVTETVRKEIIAADSSSAARGVQQVEEVFTSLRDRTGVSISVDTTGTDTDADALGLNFKAAGKKSDDDDVNDFLDSRWGDTDVTLGDHV